MYLLREIAYQFMGKLYIPKIIRCREEKIILHISDTPSSIFLKLKELIGKIKPEYIIHTGDLVDNLKLEKNPLLLQRYEEDVKGLINILEGCEAEKIYITLGNHDNEDVVKKLCKRSVVIERSASIKIDEICIGISHFSKQSTKEIGEIYLFGHDLYLQTKREDEKEYLNGITSINIVGTSTRQIIKIKYPWGTDDARLKRGRIGF